MSSWMREVLGEDEGLRDEDGTRYISKNNNLRM
jgi:hypothetical protein